jgi:CDGSH-type Zn-finger protein
MGNENVAGRAPQMVELKAGQTYAWCCCVKSSNQPF